MRILITAGSRHGGTVGIAETLAAALAEEGLRVESEIPPVPMVRQLMTLVCARGHVTFGGRVSPEGRGALGAAFARRRQGDWRDEEEVRTWAGNVADDLRADARHRAAG